MNFKKILFVAGLSVASIAAYAQEEVETEYVYNPHWYVQGQFGVQHTVGEADFSDLLSPNAQIAVGYNFNAVWGARLAINAWQSKGGVELAIPTKFTETYKWNYIAPTLEATLNVSNLVAGFNPNRLVDFGLLAGIGANFGFNNDEAADLKKVVDSKLSSTTSFGNLWDSNTGFVFKFGGNVDFKVSDRVTLGIEVNANTTTDKYNSKKAKAKNADWYVNALAGVKVALGKTYTKQARPLPPCEPQIIEKEVIKEVIKEVEVPVEVKAESIRRDIFFTIRGSQVSVAEMPKLEDIAAYLNKFPNSKVTITGYADKKTGSAKINLKYSEARAKMVADLLMNQFGIAADRISYTGKGDSEQPYPNQNDLNRVSVCVAE